MIDRRMGEITMLAEAHEREIDGIRAWYARTPGETTRGSLWFRIGSADMTLPTHGWVHLVEHLALHGLSAQRLTYNGEVGLRYTRFDVVGSGDEVVRFFDALCAWLREPNFDELDHESRVLRAEGAQRAPAAVPRHLMWRYGAGGPGLVAMDEL